MYIIHYQTVVTINLLKTKRKRRLNPKLCIFKGGPLKFQGLRYKVQQ